MLSYFFRLVSMFPCFYIVLHFLSLFCRFYHWIFSFSWCSYSIRYYSDIWSSLLLLLFYFLVICLFSIQFIYSQILMFLISIDFFCLPLSDLSLLQCISISFFGYLLLTPISYTPLLVSSSCALYFLYRLLLLPDYPRIEIYRHCFFNSIPIP